MSEQLRKLREIVKSTEAPTETRLDPRDAVGQAAIERSELWLQENKNLTPVAKYGRWKQEIRAGARITPNNKDYMWEVESNLHPKGPKFAESDKLQMIHEKLETLDDQGKDNYLSDIAREAPPSILNNLLLDKKAVSRKTAAKTQERARLANIHEFDATTRSLGQKIFKGEMSGLNPEVSISSHSEDLVKAWSANRDDIFVNDQGRIAIISEEGEEVPVFALENSSLTWEESAINTHDLYPLAKRGLSPSLEYSRTNARKTERVATLELARTVEQQPREFQASIIVDGAEISENPMGALTQSIYKTVANKLDREEYLSLRDVTRDYMARWEEVSNTIAARVNDGIVSHERGNNV